MLPTMRNDVFTHGLHDVRREMDRLFDRVLNRGWDGGGADGPTAWIPPMDIVETEDSIRCSIELPGMKADDIELTVEDDVLTVSGERSHEREERAEEGGYRRFERRWGRFERRIRLPQELDADQVQAHYENGVLELLLPKPEEKKPRRIPVEHGNVGRRIEAE